MTVTIYNSSNQTGTSNSSGTPMAASWANGVLTLTGLEASYCSTNKAWRSTTALTSPTTATIGELATELSNCWSDNETHAMDFWQTLSDSTLSSPDGDYYYYYPNGMDSTGEQDGNGNDIYNCPLACKVTFAGETTPGGGEDNPGSGEDTSLVAPTDFVATVVNNTSVQCSFTLPAGLTENATLAWQSTTTNPESGTPAWTTIVTTNKSGTELE